MKKKFKKKILFFILLILVFFGIVTYFYFNQKEEKQPKKSIKKEVEEVKTLNIIDENSKSRPIAVLIDNVKAATPQAGLQDAYMIYEIIVEGGQTRLLALFKDKETEMVGPVRSARHYYIDYALENDAILAHFGYSPQAKQDIANLKINNLNGMTNGSSAYYRLKTMPSPHNAYTSMEALKKRAEQLNYRKDTEQDVLLNYSYDEISLEKKELQEDGSSIVSNSANNIKINYSLSHSVRYEYDSTNKVYKRFAFGVEHKDRVTNKQYTFKNIIVIDVKNFADTRNSNKGRQNIENIKSGEGYYFTNGNYKKIKFEKTTRSGKTTYKDMDGNVLKVNDGNTFIQIMPTNQKITFD